MTVRVGMIGLGAMGRSHLTRLATQVPGVEITGVSDLDPEHAARVAAEFGAVPFADPRDLIAAREVDAVLVCSSGPAHAPAVITAIERGKPVFCEKPLAPSAGDCAEIMRAEQARGERLVTVGFMRRFDAAYRHLRDTVASGEFGAPLIVHSRHHNPRVPERYTREMSITDTGIHDIDIVRWLLGEEICSARVDRPRPTRHRCTQLQDPLVLVLTSASGVWVGVEIFVNNRHSYDVGCEVVAETGTMRLGDGPQGMDHNARFGPAFVAELRQWAGSVTRGVQDGPTAWDGYAAAAVCDAGVRALADGGATVPVELMERPALYR
ncbi:Gfo/Idh/MocA family oxidoreductase [Flexivirga sp. ID2601S]|uniref:Inositol 2-dehydrogenase n=1 Tax=Flexivirga aerilata TaxID=1656889 RepID=A0A849AMX9_9MICO|nr:Gfo/Idh/MocA family oxidoreductase [Flexivirga aerilata]NNG41147.1 Gfo/Idh/MocA family oxidoreductase [Flexivirga aerilata]